MKIQENVPPKGFQPVSITLTFESQEELDTFGALFNCGSVSALVDSNLWRSLKSLGANLDAPHTQLIYQIFHDLNRKALQRAIGVKS